MGMLNQAKQQQPSNGPVEGPPDEPPSGGPPDQQPNETPDGQPDAGDGAPGAEDEGADTDTPETDPSEEGGSGKPPKGKKGGGAPQAEQAVEKKFSPEQMNEFHQALKLLYIILYKNDNTNKSVVNMIQPQDKIGSLGKATVIVLHQLDKKIQLKDSAVKLAITITTVDRLVELAEKAKGIHFSKEEASHLLAAAVHGANTLFHGPQPHPGGGGAPGGSPGASQQPPGGPPGSPGATPAGGPPPGGTPPQGPPPQAGGANGALAQGAAAQAQAQSAQGMPPPPPPVPGGAQGQPPPGGK